MNRLSLILISGAIIISLLFFAFYRNSRMEHDTGYSFKQGNDRQRLEFLREELNLTDIQYNTIKSIYDRDSASVKKYRNDIMLRLDEINTEVTRDSFDENKIRRILRDIADYKTELGIIRTRHRYEISRLLSSEQKVKFNSILRQKINKIRERESEDPAQGAPR